MALYHTVKGPVDYEVVGSPTIVDGVASGFSNSNCLIVYNFSSTAPEFVLKTKYRHITNDTTDAHYLYFYSTSNGQYNGCLIRSNGYFAFANSISSQNVVSETTVAPEIGQDYVIEVRTDINTYFKAYINNNLVLDLTYTGVSGNSKTTALYIGRALVSFPLNTGSIDLNETYITVNSQPWFGKCPVEVKHISLNSNSVNYLVKDNKLVFADSGLYLSGPNTYTVQGNPTIVDNVVSGLDKTNYIYVPGFTATSRPFEFQAHFTVKDTTWGNLNKYVGVVGSNNIQFGLNGSGYLRVSGTAVSTDVVGQTVLQKGGTYWARFIYNGSDTCEIYLSTDGTNYTLEAQGTTTIASTNLRFELGTWSYNGEGVKALFLNDTYIKSNGSLWFYGKNYASQNIAPVPANYTYGTTTTSAIGYVDMSTQAFTAAPTGATLGKDA